MLKLTGVITAVLKMIVCAVVAYIKNSFFSDDNVVLIASINKIHDISSFPTFTLIGSVSPPPPTFFCISPTVQIWQVFKYYMSFVCFNGFFLSLN